LRFEPDQTSLDRLSRGAPANAFHLFHRTRLATLAASSPFNAQRHLTSRSTHRVFQAAAQTTWKTAATSGA
jgi:hypothetical protein